MTRFAVNARMLISSPHKPGGKVLHTFPAHAAEEIADVRIRQLDGAGHWEAWERAQNFDLAHRWARPG